MESDSKTSVLRWGIVSAGKISHDFCVALSTLPATEHQVVALVSRDNKRATEFAEKHGISTVFNEYLEFAKYPNMDVVYIGSVNTKHYQLAMMMLEKGKHVLCEKPLCINNYQASMLVDCSIRNKRFLMEGMSSRFFPAYEYLRQQISSGVLGEITEVNMSLGLDLIGEERIQKKALGGGVILELGSYAIQLAQWAIQQPPMDISAKGTLNSDGVDIEVTAEMKYEKQQVAKMTLSSKEKLENKAIIKGVKGQITLFDFWCPTKMIDVDGIEKEWELPKGKYPTNYKNAVGLRYEAEAVRKDIIAGKFQNSSVCSPESLLFALIEDEMREQLQVFFPEDAEARKIREFKQNM